MCTRIIFFLSKLYKQMKAKVDPLVERKRGGFGKTSRSDWGLWNVCNLIL